MEAGAGAGEESKASGASATPVLSLPKGGGAVRGMGEKFAADPVTGTGSLSIPVLTTPGRAGFGPQLTLGYDSGAGNDPFAVGQSRLPVEGPQPVRRQAPVDRSEDRRRAMLAGFQIGVN